MSELVEKSSHITPPWSPPYRHALLSQLIGTVMALGLAAIVPAAFGNSPGMHVWIGVQALGAAGAALALRMPWWWLGLNLLFGPALALALMLSVPPQLAAGAFLLLLLLYGGTQSTRVPLYLSNAAAVRALIALMPANRPLAFLDLGCGIGTVLHAVARARPQGGFAGVERAPLPYLVAWLRARISGTRWRVSWSDLWSVDLSAQDVVYVYLSPAAMPKLWNKVCREMRPGTLFVSFRFPVPGAMPTEVIEVGGSRLYVWRLP